MTEPRRERYEWARRKGEHAVVLEEEPAPVATETALVSFAQQGAAGEISLDDAMTAARRLTYPVYREADGGHWFDGVEDNTIQAVQALLGTGLTFEQFAKLAEAFAEN